MPDPWDDGWPDAAANSLACWDLAMSEMRKKYMTDTIEHARIRRRDWGPTKPRLDRNHVLARLADYSVTLGELARELGYSESWLQHLGSMQGLNRPRGGDRRSPAAKARYA